MRENLGGVDVASVGPLVGELVLGSAEYSVWVIVPDKTGKGLYAELCRARHHA
jgi:hypothetical protein